MFRFATSVWLYALLAVPVLAHRVVPRSDGGPSGDGGRLAIEGILWDLRAP